MDWCDRLPAAKAAYDALIMRRWDPFRYIPQFSRNHFETCRGYSWNLILSEYAKNEKRIFSKFLGARSPLKSNDHAFATVFHFKNKFSVEI